MKNISKIDRTLRTILALMLVGIGYFLTSGAISIVLYIVAAILLFTSITGYCGLYHLFRFSTNK